MTATELLLMMMMMMIMMMMMMMMMMMSWVTPPTGKPGERKTATQ